MWNIFIINPHYKHTTSCSPNLCHESFLSIQPSPARPWLSCRPSRGSFSAIQTLDNIFSPLTIKHESHRDGVRRNQNFTIVKPGMFLVTVNSEEWWGSIRKLRGSLRWRLHYYDITLWRLTFVRQSRQTAAVNWNWEKLKVKINFDLSDILLVDHGLPHLEAEERGETTGQDRGDISGESGVNIQMMIEASANC